MALIDIPVVVRTPTSFLFFCASAALAYFTPGHPALGYFSFSAALWFGVLGHSYWLNLPKEVDYVGAAIGFLLIIVGVFLS